MLLTLFLGPFGLLLVRWQVAVALFLGWEPLTAVAGHWSVDASPWFRPVCVATGVLSVTWHNWRLRRAGDR